VDADGYTSDDPCPDCTDGRLAVIDADERKASI